MEYRTIDANFNRLREGLRVIEDIMRYELNATHVIQKLKELRHSVSVCDKATFEQRILYRDAENDEGFDNIGENENIRENKKDILRANFLRAQEASRVLEELFKGDDKSKLSPFMKDVRYSLYELEKEVYLSLQNSKKFDLSLYLVTQSTLNAKPLHEVVEEAIKGGVTIVQLREKNFPDKDILEIAKPVVEVCNKYNIPVVVDDRVDLCLALNADGVHIGQDDLPASVVRKILGNDKIIGLSTSTLEEVKQAQDLPIDYIGFGALYSTPTKDKYEITGLKIIKEVLSISELPVVFIGGVTHETVKDVKEHGAPNIAVVRAIMEEEDPKDAAIRLLQY